MEMSISSPAPEPGVKWVLRTRLWREGRGDCEPGTRLLKGYGKWDGQTTVTPAVPPKRGILIVQISFSFFLSLVQYCGTNPIGPISTSLRDLNITEQPTREFYFNNLPLHNTTLIS